MDFQNFNLNYTSSYVGWTYQVASSKVMYLGRQEEFRAHRKGIVANHESNWLRTEKKQRETHGKPWEMISISLHSSRKGVSEVGSSPGASNRSNNGHGSQFTVFLRSKTVLRS